MDRFSLIESQPARLRISQSLADELADLGQRLASRSTWWGEEDPSERRSVVRCRAVGNGEFEVTVIDCVGLIAVADIQIEVRPKIPVTHLLYLLAAAGDVPRFDDTRALAEAGDDLWHLLALWFTKAAEQLLRRDLAKDYSRCEDETQVLRGRIRPVPSARAYYQGRLRLHCEFEEFIADMPLNRVVKAAAARVMASEALPLALRRRARALVSRFDDVGELRLTDFRSRPDRRTAHYSNSHSLARHILTGVLRTIALGRAPAWTFLFRTPEMVEVGVRRIVEDSLRSRSGVAKRGVRLANSTMTLNPDIVIGDSIAVADVKYKLCAGEWVRSDLYQIVSFAEAFGTNVGAIIGFVGPGEAGLAPLAVGRKRLIYLGWNADPRVAPETAAELLSGRVREWIALELESGALGQSGRVLKSA